MLRLEILHRTASNVLKLVDESAGVGFAFHYCAFYKESRFAADSGDEGRKRRYGWLSDWARTPGPRLLGVLFGAGVGARVEPEDTFNLRALTTAERSKVMRRLQVKP